MPSPLPAPMGPGAVPARLVHPHAMRDHVSVRADMLSPNAATAVAAVPPGVPASAVAVPSAAPGVRGPTPLPHPPHAPPPRIADAHARLATVLDTIQHEFDLLHQDASAAHVEREEVENIISNQLQEVHEMRHQFAQLEKRHTAMAAHYDEQIYRLRMQLQAQGASAEERAFDERERDERRYKPVAGAPVPVGGGAPPSEWDHAPPTPAARGPVPVSVREAAHDARDSAPEAKRIRLAEPAARGDWTGERELPAPPPFEERKDVQPAHAHPHAHAHSPVSPTLQQRWEEPRPVETLVNAAATAAAESNRALAKLSDLDPDDVPKELKTEGSDWLAIFNPRTKRVLDVNLMQTLMHESVVCCVRFSPDGKLLATGCNRKAQIYDTKTGAKVAELPHPYVPNGDLYICSVCFSPDGASLATGAEDKHVRIWDIASGKMVHLLQGHKQEIYSLDWSADGALLASGSGDRTVRIWETDKGTLRHTCYIDPNNEQPDLDHGVTSVSIHPSSRLVAAGSLDSVVRVWDAATARQVESLPGHTDSIYSVAFSPDGSYLVSGSLDKTIKKWDLSATLGKVLGGANLPPPTPGREEPHHAAQALEANSAGNGAGTGTGASAGATEVSVSTFEGHRDYVLSVSCSPDAEWVVSGSKDRAVQFWRPSTGEAQFVLHGHKNSVIAIHCSPAGSLFATGSGDFNARIWSYERTAPDE